MYIVKSISIDLEQHKFARAGEKTRSLVIKRQDLQLRGRVFESRKLDGI